MFGIAGIGGIEPPESWAEEVFEVGKNEFVGDEPVGVATSPFIDIRLISRFKLANALGSP